jgi:hypothetical protein
MSQGSSQSATNRRASYLAKAIELRQRALAVHSPQLRDGFMRLAVLYEELAEYAAKQDSTMPPAKPD